MYRGSITASLSADRPPASWTRSANACAKEQEPLDGIRRARLLAALAEVVVERGLRGVSIAAVTRRACVSRTAFADLFESVDASFLELLDGMLNDAATAVAGAVAHERHWRDGVLSGLEALLRFLDSQPVIARACLLQSVAGSPLCIESRTEPLTQLAALVDRARNELSLERQPPAAMSQAIIASVLGMLRMRLSTGAAPPFATMLGELAEIVVAPYLGPRAAAQAARAGDERARRAYTAATDEDIEVPFMLVHGGSHRMRSCLRCLAEQPGISNQAIAASIGIAHPGQASVLLGRLYDAGLLTKRRGGAGRPNAWSLTSYGAQVARTLDIA